MNPKFHAQLMHGKSITTPKKKLKESNYNQLSGLFCLAEATPKALVILFSGNVLLLYSNFKLGISKKKTRQIRIGLQPKNKLRILVIEACNKIDTST